MKLSIYTLIAMWLWCTAAAGGTLPVTTQSLEQKDYTAILAVPCNWDRDLNNVSVNAVYANPGESTDVSTYSILDPGSIVNVPVTPLETLNINNDKLLLKFDRSLPKTHDGKFLYHLNVDIGTTNKKCQSGFGFGGFGFGQ